MSDILTPAEHREKAETDAPADAVRVWRDENGVWYADVPDEAGVRVERVYAESPLPAEVDLYDLIGGDA